tara:strand:- start:1073 stop:1621 length:549 start_codon:yes stop_codon:yes gene_type:complete
MDIDTFKTNFDGGTRPNRFVVEIDMGEYGDIKNQFMVKAASMPAESVGILQVPFRGRVAKLPGDRAYPEWTFTMLDEITDDIRGTFQKWHNDFNDHKENVVKSLDQLSGVGTSFGTATVKQLDMMGNVIRCRQLMRTWPVEVGAIDLSYDVADTLTEYSITLAYDYLQDCQGAGGAGGPGAN